MDRASRRNLDNAAERLSRAMRRAGYERWASFKLEHGSVVNGNPWRLYGTGDERWIPGVDGYGLIGFTAKEALQTLHTLRRTYEDIGFLKERSEQ